MIDFEQVYNAPDYDVLYNKGRWITPHLGKILYDIVEKSGAKVVIESGTANGYSGLCMASALPKDGILYTFDPVDRPKLWNDPDLRDYLKQIKGTIEKIFYCKATFIRGVKHLPLSTEPILFYIDGNHKQVIVAEEIAWLMPRIKPGDTIVFDDYNATGYAAVDRVNRAVHKSGLLENVVSYTSNRFLVVKI